ncbi:hypothetical protein ZIOFF_003459 [Zingiber officinale]|uniref:DENR N-terminal domain-containing protein n=1 Tax=Zingiber officinale TaxID=94328 RepID=A0A8J5I8Q5_ZINOF|nr:hypothetical protein ZIOFF_003459 [Zingiber officinale]
MADQRQPVRVLYCGVCSLPSEYCEYGPDFVKCKLWLRVHAPNLYPDLPSNPSLILKYLLGTYLVDMGINFAFSNTYAYLLIQGPTEKEQIDVQGDIAYDMVEFITETWQNVIFLVKYFFIVGSMESICINSCEVPETAIFFIEEGTKVAAA